MIRLRRFRDEVSAENAAAFLRDNGINAAVVGDHVATAFGSGLTRFFGVDLIVPTGTDRAEAERLLEEFASEPIEMDEGWEDAALPDLSGLDPVTHGVSCPHCAVALPLDGALESCPSCSRPVDVAWLVAQTHGPEALAGCYEDDSVMGFALKGDGASCSFCGYNLRGLALRGRCPECGSLYDVGGAMEDRA